MNENIGGLLFKPGSSNLQHATTLSFLLLVYAKTLHRSSRTIHCNNVVANPSRLVEIAKNQVSFPYKSHIYNNKMIKYFFF